MLRIILRYVRCRHRLSHIIECAHHAAKAGSKWTSDKTADCTKRRVDLKRAGSESKKGPARRCDLSFAFSVSSWHCESTDHANFRCRLFTFGKVSASIPVLVLLSLEKTSRQTTGHVVVYMIFARAAYMRLKYWPSNAAILVRIVRR